MPLLMTNPSYLTLSSNPDLKEERIATSGAGIILTDSGEGGNLTFDFDYIDLVHKRVGFVEDFFGDTLNLGGYIFMAYAGGTGSEIRALNVSEPSVYGVLSLDTGSLTAGSAVICNTDQTNNTVQSFRLGQGVTMMEAKIQIPVLSDGTEGFKIICGMVDQVANPTMVDGVYFEYLSSASANWRYCTSNDSSRTENNSSTAVGTGWTKLKIIVNADASLVEYFINDTSIGTINSNIPTAAGDELKCGYGIFKTAGTTDRYTYIDYYAFQIELTTPR